MAKKKPKPDTQEQLPPSVACEPGELQSRFDEARRAWRDLLSAVRQTRIELAGRREWLNEATENAVMARFKLGVVTATPTDIKAAQDAADVLDRQLEQQSNRLMALEEETELARQQLVSAFPDAI